MIPATNGHDTWKWGYKKICGTVKRNRNMFFAAGYKKMATVNSPCKRQLSTVMNSHIHCVLNMKCKFIKKKKYGHDHMLKKDQLK